MSTTTMPPTERPLPTIPSGAHKSDVWLDAAGKLNQHAIELPVDKATKKINGRLFACVVQTCSTGHWVIEPKTELEAKHTFCPVDGGRLAFVPLDDTQADPIAAGRQRQLAWLTGILADKASRRADVLKAAAAARLASARDTAAQGLTALATDMVTSDVRKGHLPSIAATALVEVGVLYTVDLTGALEAAALAAAIGTWGAIIGYYVAVGVEKVRLRRRTEGFEGRAAKKARGRGLYAARAMVATGIYFATSGMIDAAWGLDVTSGWQSSFLAVLGLGLAWVVNREHWDRLWADRRRLRALAAENAQRAADEAARRAAEEAALLAEEAGLRERLAEVGAYDENDPVHQGQRMKIEWERIARLDTARDGFMQIDATWIVPEQTREITAPDPETGERVRVGWEYLGQCKPGALISKGAPVPPVLGAKEWLVSVIEDGRYEPSMISLVDRPGERANTFLLMITEKARLGEDISWKGRKGIRIQADGARYGHLGRALTGDDLEELLYRAGQAFGGLVTGTTGGGKGGHAMRYILNCLMAGILPVLFDPKGLVDYADFIGIFPIGHTEEHREIILKSLHAERRRRQAVMASAPKTNRYGAEVAGESKWQCRLDDGTIGPFGEPIASIWDEFHDLAKDDKFIRRFSNLVRFQRAAGIGALLLTQGGGLEDLGSSVLRGLVNQTSLTSYRSDDLQSRLGGSKNQAYATSELPMLPGMCLREAVGSPKVPLRAAYITRDTDAEDTVFTTLWGKGAQKALQIPDPMDWISDDTKALWEKTGLMELWRKARGEGGLDRLLADAKAHDEDDEDPEEAQIRALLAGTPAALTAAVSAGAVAPARMVARDVLLAILHEEPGISLEEIRDHDAWYRAPGWVKPPAMSTITRAAQDLDPTIGGEQPLREGQQQLIDRGPGSKSWTLTTAGTAAGAQAGALLTPRAPQAPLLTGVTRAGFDSPADIERRAQRAAELAGIAEQEARMAARTGR